MVALLLAGVVIFTLVWIAPVYRALLDPDLAADDPAAIPLLQRTPKTTSSTTRPRDARRAKLRDFQLGTGDRFTYLYDFGDHWEHEVRVEEVLPSVAGEAYPSCTDGARACPPEDCGSIPGYEALVNPRHPDHRDLMQWAGGFDPEAFDLEQVNRLLQGRQKRAVRPAAATPPITRMQPGERIPVPLSQLHRSLILGHAYISPELEARVRGKAVSLDLDDLHELCGAVASEMNHCEEERLRSQWRGLYDHLHAIEDRYTDEDLPITAVLSRLVQPVRYTPKQGQYLAFIYAWTRLHGIAPSEAEMQAYFEVSAPAVHQMVRALEDRGLIERIPRQPRSIRLLIPREELPELE
jgi:hypothetical protein